jgi:ABC-2 type transport system permease protein
MPAGMRAVARLEPFTYAVSLQRGLWRGDGWTTHATDVFALGAIFLICTLLSAKIFRWE